MELRGTKGVGMTPIVALSSKDCTKPPVDLTYDDPSIVFFVHYNVNDNCLAIHYKILLRSNNMACGCAQPPPPPPQKKKIQLPLTSIVLGNHVHKMDFDNPPPGPPPKKNWDSPQNWTRYTCMSNNSTEARGPKFEQNSLWTSQASEYVSGMSDLFTLLIYLSCSAF